MQNVLALDSGSPERVHSRVAHAGRQVRGKGLAGNWCRVISNASRRESLNSGGERSAGGSRSHARAPTQFGEVGTQQAILTARVCHFLPFRSQFRRSLSVAKGNRAGRGLEVLCGLMRVGASRGLVRVGSAVLLEFRVGDPVVCFRRVVGVGGEFAM